MSGCCGRGPTRDMSPRSTFRSCGSSSILSRRSGRPNAKTRGSCCAVMTLREPRACRCMVRSLYIVNGCPSRPTRRARYRIGPGLERRIPTAATSRTGTAATRPSTATTTSKRRLATAQAPSYRHEHLGGVEAAVIPPGVRAMPQRLERAGLGVRPDLALVARHGAQLLLERLGAVDPRVGDEGSRVAPLGAQGRVEGVHRLEVRLDRPRGHERGAEQQLVVAVGVAPELAVDDRRAHVAHHALERRDEIDQRQRVEPLIGEAQLAGLPQAERPGGAADMLGLPDALWSVAERLPLTRDHGRHLVARSDVQRGRAAAPEHLVVGVSRNDQYAVAHRRRPQRRYRRTMSKTAAITSAASASETRALSGRLSMRR